MWKFSFKFCFFLYLCVSLSGDEFIWYAIWVEISLINNDWAVSDFVCGVPCLITLSFNQIVVSLGNSLWHMQIRRKNRKRRRRRQETGKPQGGNTIRQKCLQTACVTVCSFRQVLSWICYQEKGSLICGRTANPMPLQSHLYCVCARIYVLRFGYLFANNFSIKDKIYVGFMICKMWNLECRRLNRHLLSLSLSISCKKKYVSVKICHNITLMQQLFHVGSKEANFTWNADEVVSNILSWWGWSMCVICVDVHMSVVCKWYNKSGW